MFLQKGFFLTLPEITYGTRRFWHLISGKKGSLKLLALIVDSFMTSIGYMVVLFLICKYFAAFCDLTACPLAYSGSHQQPASVSQFEPSFSFHYVQFFHWHCVVTGGMSLARTLEQALKGEFGTSTVSHWQRLNYWVHPCVFPIDSGWFW